MSSSRGRYGLRVEKRSQGKKKSGPRHTHYVTVERGAGGDLSPDLTLVTSSAYAQPLGDGWDDGVPAAVASRRRRRSGAAKGRVIYLLQDGVPVGVLAFHVPDRGALTVELVRAARPLGEKDRRAVEVLLLDVAAEVARLAGLSTTRLCWAPLDATEVDRAASRYGFERMKARGTKGIVFERKIPPSS